MFREEFEVTDLTEDDVDEMYVRSSRQFRDGCIHYREGDDGVKITVNRMTKKITGSRHKELPKDLEGRSIIDCNVYSRTIDPKLVNEDYFKCVNCGKHKLLHSSMGKCKFEEPRVESYRKIFKPTWLSEDRVVFVNRKPTDVLDNE